MMFIRNKLGSSCLLIGAIVLAVLQPSTALNATAANDVCNLLEDGINIFSGISCGEYYVCNGGVATLTSCSNGYYFSKESQSCQPPSVVTCGTLANEPCVNVGNGVFVAVPNSCSNFYYCNNGVGVLGTCPDGLNFDPVDQSCNYTLDYSCSQSNGGFEDSIDFCSYIPPQVFFGSSSSCRIWQVCRSTGLVVGTCTEPYFYNVVTGDCDFEANVSCRQLSGNSNTGTDAGYLSGTACSTNGLVVSDNITCAGYYTCSNNKYSYGTCSGALYFNPVSKTCVNRVDAVNDCNRCEDTTLEFVNVYQDNCVGYAYCKNGRMSSTGVCASGYFNEIEGSCILDGSEPQFPVCNESISGLTTESSSTTKDDTATTTVESTKTTDKSATTTKEDTTSTTEEPTTTTKK